MMEEPNTSVNNTWQNLQRRETFTDEKTRQISISERKKLALILNSLKYEISLYFFSTYSRASLPVKKREPTVEANA